jgi:hypothetical protein
MNLGWKLAVKLSPAGRGRASDWLLDTYEAERHPVGAAVLAMTDTLNQLVLGRSAVRRVLQRFVIRAILHFPRSRRLMAERLSASESRIGVLRGQTTGWWASGCPTSSARAGGSTRSCVADDSCSSPPRARPPLTGPASITWSTPTRRCPRRCWSGPTVTSHGPAAKRRVPQRCRRH